MTTIRVDSEDFREFIGWLIWTDRIKDKWEHIKLVYARPELWMEQYLKFQEDIHEEEKKSMRRKPRDDNGISISNTIQR